MQFIYMHEREENIVFSYFAGGFNNGAYPNKRPNDNSYQTSTGFGSNKNAPATAIYPGML